jgi:ribosome-associated protein
MIKITPNIFLDESEIKFTFIRAPGPGGQNVNKVATAVQLRFDAMHSPSLPENVRARLLTLAGNKITTEGELIFKASRYRTQERNKQDALDRLQELLIHAATPPKKRKKTKPTYASKQRRLEKKKLHGKKKSIRQHKIDNGD